MERNTILKRDSLGSSLDYIYPDFKKCQLILFSLALLEYLNILVLTYYNSKKNFIKTRELITIYAFEFLGLIFVVLALRTLNKKKWRKKRGIIFFFTCLIAHIAFYVVTTVLSCYRIWRAYVKTGNMGSSFTIILYTVLSSLLVIGQIIYCIIFMIYTKNTWRAGDESLV